MLQVRTRMIGYVPNIRKVDKLVYLWLLYVKVQERTRVLSVLQVRTYMGNINIQTCMPTSMPAAYT